MRMSQILPRRVLVASCAIVAIVLLASAAYAQDSNSPPASDAPTALVSVRPPAGFTLDPFFVSLQGGGRVDAAILDKSCTGFVPTVPSVAFEHQGDADLLRMFFYSDGDPVLVVQEPDGSFLCNDNTNLQVLDPTVHIAAPTKGRYTVWVGSRRSNDLIPGVLVFTERPAVDLGTFSPVTLVRRPALPALLPTRDRVAAAARRLVEARVAANAVALAADGTPLTSTVTAQGVLPAIELTSGDRLCNGLISLKPDLAFRVGDASDAVSIYFEGDADTALLVHGPDDALFCADDGQDPTNLNPSLIISEAAAGDYLVWVGRVDPSEPVTGTLTVVTGEDSQPQILEQP
jgi:hypothetical protein